MSRVATESETPSQVQTLHVPARVRGRVLVRAPAARPASGVLVGFHGYAETAEPMLERLATIPGLDGWVLASVQALHPFYRRRHDEVVASWMTRQDRELAIEDNVAYTRAVLARLRDEWPAARPLVIAGFSQGVAMAYRTATADGGCDGLIVLGGDVPPELDDAALAALPPVLLGRGDGDPRYPAQQLAVDVERLRRASTGLEIATFDGGHEWTAEFAAACASWLERLA